MTPSAVPGIIRVSTKSAGNPNWNTRIPLSTTRFTTLSRSNAKNAFVSPRENSDCWVDRGMGGVGT